MVHKAAAERYIKSLLYGNVFLLPGLIYPIRGEKVSKSHLKQWARLAVSHYDWRLAAPSFFRFSGHVTV
jgi:hypothetical protein